MKKVYYLLVFLFFAVTTTKAQVDWDYEVSNTPFIGVVPLTDSVLLYQGPDCNNCSFYFNADDYFEDGFDSFTSFEFYGESLEYIRVNSEGLIRFNNYLSSSDYGEALPSYDELTIQWGGSSNGQLTHFSYKVWPLMQDGPNVLTFQFAYRVGYNSTDYFAMIQVHLIEYLNIIELNYFNTSGTTSGSNNCGVNYGDNIHYTMLDNDAGAFPSTDGTYVLYPGYTDELDLINLDFEGENFACDLEPMPVTIGILNRGSNAQSNFDVNLYVNDVLTETMTITEALNQFAYAEHTFTTMIGASGDGEIVSVSAEIDMLDENVDNNMKGNVMIDYITAEVENSAVCYGSPMTVQASGADYYVWRDPETGAILEFGPDTYTTPYNVYEGVPLEVLGGSNACYLSGVDDTFFQVDHDNVSGDDRGGIAVTPEYLYIVGDDATVRMSANDLSGQVALPIRDGIFSDLTTGTLYTLYNSTLEEDLSDDYSSFPFTIDAIAEMDEDLNITSNIIMLDEPFEVYDDNTECGVFAGLGIVLVKDGIDNDLYKIDINTGEVDSLGVYNNLEDDWNTENWAMWGFTESAGGEAISIIFPYDDSYLYRLDLGTGEKEMVANFIESSSGYYPDDLHSITASPWHNRIYFHSETYDEDGGYINAVIGLSGDCWISIEPEIVEEAWAGYDANVHVCNDMAVELIDFIPGEPNDGGDWTDVNSSGALTGGMLDATQLDEGTYEFVYTVNPMAPCVDDAQVTLTVHVNEAANAGNGSDAEVCDNAVYYNLNESLDGTQDMYGYWSDDDAAGVLNGSIIELETLALGDYTFSYHAFGFGACEEDVESITVTVEDCSGIEDLSAEFIVYPNPSNGNVYINIPNHQSGEISVTLTDVQGRIVYENILTSNRVDLTGLPEGMYYMEIGTDKMQSIRKIVIQ